MDKKLNFLTILNHIPVLVTDHGRSRSAGKTTRHQKMKKTQIVFKEKLYSK